MNLMHYREYAPHARLASMIDCVWTLEGAAVGPAHAAGDAEGQPVLPDGRAELIAHLGDPFERVCGSGVVRQPSLIFAGQLTGRLVLRPTGRIAVLGVRFRPDSARGLIGVPQHELVGLTIGIDEVSAPLARLLTDACGSAASLADAARLVQERLLHHVQAVDVDWRVRHVVEAIRRRHGRVLVDALAADVGLTRRHLERRFQDLVGLSPKRLARISRFQRALARLEHADAARPGTITAIECGYADQAHFIRDFRDLAGCPPGSHLLRNAELTGFFVERNRMSRKAL